MTVQDAIEHDGTGSDDGPSKTEAAKNEAGEVAGTVKEQGAAVSGAARDGAQNVAAQAKQQVGELNEQVQTQLREVLGRSQSELSERASEQTTKAASNLRGLSEELRALADGRPQDASRMAGYAGQVADRAAAYSDRLDRDGFGGLASDLSRFARRRPGVFLLSAVAAGFAAGRLARGAQAAKAAPTDPALPTATSPGGTELGSDFPTSPVAEIGPGGLDTASGTAAAREPLVDVSAPMYPSGETAMPGGL